MLRRLAYAIALTTFISEITLVNVLIQILLSVGLTLYVSAVMPFEVRRDNYIEIMNETCIVLTLYLSLGLIVDDSIVTGEMK